MEQAVVDPPGAALNESQLQAMDRLHDEISPICGHLNVCHAQLVRCTVDALATNGWAGVGIMSPEHWLCLLAGVSRGRAEKIVAIARRWHELPVTMAAFAVGELSLEQTYVVAKTVRAFNDAEACQVARHALVSQLSYALRRYRYKPDPKPEDQRTAPVDEDAPGDVDAPGEDADDAAPDDPPPASAPNRVWFGYDDEGRYRVTFDLDPLSGALVDKALREARNALFGAGRPSTFADAVAEIAARSLAAITNADRRDLYRVYLHLDANGTWIDQGPAVPSLLFDKITCDGTVILLSERNGRPVEIFEPTKTITNHLRRLVLDRDHRCRFPGCGRHVHLEVHHVRHRANLGPSTLDNLAALCPLHHDLVHRGALTISGNAEAPGGLTFRDAATGHVVREHRPPAPPGDTPPPAPPPGHAWRHPDGERFHHDCLVFREPPADYQPPPGDPPATRSTAA